MVVWMKQLYEILNEQRSDLNRSEVEVAEYFLAYELEIPKLRLHDVAQACFVSTTTVIRLCKKMGFDGFKAVQVFIQLNQSEPPTTAITKQDKSRLDDKSQLILDNVFQTLTKIDHQQIQTIARLFCEGKRVDIYGLASSRYICEDLSRKLKMLGIWANSVYEEEMIHLLSSKLQESDIVFVISLTGNNTALVQALEVAKKRGAQTVSLTNDTINRCAGIADITIFVKANTGSVSYNRYRPRYIFMVVLELIVGACIEILDERESLSKG
ncbi:RpiR family transcriptional regulator [Erysipelotrichaceae bacterium]|nr:RpiR family transcriptional regulator [Erysipelotrichaceae bacterium]